MTQTMAEPAGRQRPPKVRLGEELPIFCEKCGYSLHGAPQLRCDHCTLLHFICAECGHRQHINTLRPAVGRWLGRLRAATLGLAVFFKLNYFGWLLFAWAAMGYEWSFIGNVRMRGMGFEAIAAFLCFGLAFGLLGRMLLLKWKRSWAVGAVVAALAALATIAGAAFRYQELRERFERFGVNSGSVVMARWTWEMPLQAAGLTFLGVFLGALVAWPIWVGLVRMFLPRRTGDALLDWQRGDLPDALGVR